MYRYRGYCLCAGVTRIVEVCLHISPNTAGIAKITWLSKTAANAEKREKYRGKLDKNENTRGKKEWKVVRQNVRKNVMNVCQCE